MTLHDQPPFSHAASDLERLLPTHRPLVVPEFEDIRHRLEALRQEPHAQAMFAEADTLLTDVDRIPQTTYSRFQAFVLRGDREPYEAAYFLKRQTLNALVTRFLMGRGELKDPIQDYLWDICEESTWVVPAHARVIDLMSAETAFWLAEVLYLIGDDLDEEVRRRAQREIDQRVLAPFLQSHFDLRWFNGRDNWNGVCSGAIGCAFLYLERDPKRLARALGLVVESLGTYLATAFEEDGGSTEGVGYWHYGLTNVVIFAELLRTRSAGAIDLLADPKLQRIASFPAKMVLPNGRFVSFSDCPTEVPISPGIIARLAERTGDPSLLGLLSPASPLHHEPGGPRGLRDLLWWDGQRHALKPLEALKDSVLPATGIARVTSSTPDGAPIVLIAKAGHNDENHNHNDVGSFVLNIAGEDFLTDPGPGRVDRDYFSDACRYENIFANSRGHSVPVIGGLPQGTGRAFAGSLHGIEYDAASGQKRVIIEFARAYPLPALEQAQRRFSIDQRASAIWLGDRFRFADQGHDVEDVFVTWLPVNVDGAVVSIQGTHHHLRLTVEDPPGVEFVHESLGDESRANGRTEVLQRLRVKLPGARTLDLRLRLDILPIRPTGLSPRATPD